MKLPQVQAGPALVTAPRSSIDAKDFQRLGAAQAGSFSAIGDLLDGAAVPLAEQQARQDALAEADVTRNEDGSLNVQPRRDPMLVGKAADAYARTHEVAFATALRNSTNTALQDLANKTWLPADQGGGGGDPAWFEREAGHYITGIAEKQHGNQIAVQEEGNRIAGEYFRNLQQKKAAIDAQSAKATLDERMARLEDDLSNLAFSGVQGEAFTAKLTELETLRQTKMSDPRMGYAAEAAKRDSELLKRDLGAQAIIGAARRDYQTDWNLQRVQQDAEKKLTELGLPPREMLKYLGEVNTHLRSTDAAIQQHRAELTAEADSLVERMKTSRTTDDRSVNDLQDKLRSARLYAKAAQLEAQRATNALLPVITTGPASAAAEAMGGVRAGAVTGVATAYGPGAGGIEGGPNDMHGRPVATLEDFEAGRVAAITIAGSKAFAGRGYTIPEITFTGSDGKTRTLKNVPAIVSDTGGAFTDAPEGRFDIPVAKGMSSADLAKQPFSRQQLQFVPVGPRAEGRQIVKGSANLMRVGAEWGDPRSPTFARDNIVNISAPNGASIGVNKAAKVAFEGFLGELAARGYQIKSIGGFNVRTIDGTDTLSQHAFGNAIDLNAGDNPVYAPFGVGKSDLPADVSDLAAKWGLSWGGDWRTKKDPMHFEWTGVVTAAARSAGAVERPGHAGAPVAAGPQGAPQTPRPATPYSDNPVFRATVAELQKEYDARFKTLWGQMDGAWGAGRQPSQAEVNDLATLYPLVSDPDLRRTVSERLAVEGAKADSNGLDMTSLGEAVRIGETRAATGEASALERQIADGLADQQKRRSAILDGHPADYSQVYLDPKATGVRLGALPLDDAAGFAAGLQARQQAVDLVKRQEPTAGANPLRAGEATNLARLLPNAAPGQAAAYVQTLAETLKPEQLAAALAAENKALAVAVKGMAMSGDPAKMSAAFALMDRVDRDNPDCLVATFGEESQKTLDVWNAKTQFRPADVVAKEMMARNDPSAVAARKELETEAHRLVFGKDGSGGMTAADIAGQFDTSLGGMRPNAWLLPESMTPALEQGMLRQDFARQFAAYYAETGDQDQAAALAAKRIGQVWGVSAANGGRIMRYPPESRLKDVNGSKGYVREQLYADMTPVLQAMGTKFQSSAYRGVEMPFGSASTAEPSFVLVADDKTKADIGAGRSPSYQVIALHEGEHVLVTNDKGEPQRWRPDEQAALGAANAKALEMNAVLSRRRQFDSMFGRHGAGSPAFYNARGER